MKLQRYTFEKVGDGWQFTTTTDGLWVMAKDVEKIEHEVERLREGWINADRIALGVRIRDAARPEGTALSLLKRARECVAYCVSVDDGSWAQHNLSYADLLAKIDALLPQKDDAA